MTGERGKKNGNKPSLLKITSGVGTSVCIVYMCVCVCDHEGSVPPHPPDHRTPPHRTALSHFIICSAAPGCSGTSRPLWIHLLLLFSTDNWLEQWNAPPRPLYPHPQPLKPNTLFIFRRSHFCSDPLFPSPPNPPPPFYGPCLASPPTPLAPSTPVIHLRGFSHENDIFDQPHQYVSLSI